MRRGFIMGCWSISILIKGWHRGRISSVRSLPPRGRWIFRRRQPQKKTEGVFLSPPIGGNSLSPRWHSDSSLKEGAKAGRRGRRPLQILSNLGAGRRGRCLRRPASFLNTAGASPRPTDSIPIWCKMVGADIIRPQKSLRRRVCGGFCYALSVCAHRRTVPLCFYTQSLR